MSVSHFCNVRSNIIVTPFYDLFMTWQRFRVENFQVDLERDNEYEIEN